MKTKNYLFLLLILVSGKVFSQDYIPVLDNASWIVKAYFFGGSQTFSIIQDGEQTVGPHTYKKYVTPGTSAVYLLREDSAARKVYKLIDNVDVLFFDFNLNASDNITLSNGQNYTVISVSNIDVTGGQRRQWYLNNNSPFGYDEVWIEGVGCNEHPVKASYEMIVEEVYLLQCSSQNGVYVYNQGLANGGTPTDCLSLGIDENAYSTPQITFAPNPFQTDLMISSELSFNNSTLKMYNAMGQIVKQIDHLSGNKIALTRDHLTSGLYLIQLFENGKLVTSNKILVRD
ncbi:MAG: T9SS type A sorting domain-containing protein [Flavobacterium sp.]|nr:T9SS type A sorting domain-containing protein [Flavobacterium sp.]